MFLTGHSAIGLIAASWTANPALAFLIGFLSHYVADAVPHGDEDLGVWTERGNAIHRLAFLMFLDLAVLTLSFSLLFNRYGWQWNQVLCIVGACLPDFMWGFEKAVGHRLFGPFGDWHRRNHNRWRVRIPSVVGVPVQLALTVGLWWLLVR